MSSEILVRSCVLFDGGGTYRSTERVKTRGTGAACIGVYRLIVLIVPYRLASSHDDGPSLFTDRRQSPFKLDTA